MNTRSAHASPHQQSREALRETPLLLSVPQAARLLGIGATFAWELVHSGSIPTVKLGRRVLVPRTALEHLARCQEAETDVRDHKDIWADVVDSRARRQLSDRGDVRNT